MTESWLLRHAGNPVTLLTFSFPLPHSLAPQRGRRKRRALQQVPLGALWYLAWSAALTRLLWFIFISFFFYFFFLPFYLFIFSELNLFLLCLPLLFVFTLRKVDIVLFLPKILSSKKLHETCTSQHVSICIMLPSLSVITVSGTLSSLSGKTLFFVCFIFPPQSLHFKDQNSFALSRNL